MSADDAIDNSIKIITTDEDFTSSNKNLQAAGRESSVEKKNIRLSILSFQDHNFKQ
jgi:hypothetical protein